MNLNEYVPRSVFTPLHNRDKRWVCVVAHRRCGKTVAMCADLVIGALETALPKPQFAYMAPQRDQAKRVAWTYLKDLTRPMWSKPPNESELKITINNGHGGESTIYVAGADNYDALRGMYFDGVVLDEVGQIRPSAWYKVLRPALSDRRGWAIFAGTPAGKNMFWNLREEARMNPETHLLLELPASKTGIIHPDELRDAKAQMTEDAFLVEYECSFDAAVPGAYYAKQISEIYGLGRVGDFKPQADMPVHLVADLGFSQIAIRYISCFWIKRQADGAIYATNVFAVSGVERPVHGEDNICVAFIFWVSVHLHDGPSVCDCHFSFLLVVPHGRVMIEFLQ